MTILFNQGTVTATDGSADISFANAALLPMHIQHGDEVVIDGTFSGFIDTVNHAAQTATIKPPFAGTSGSGKDYVIRRATPVSVSASEALERTFKLLNEISVFDSEGVGLLYTFNDSIGVTTPGTQRISVNNANFPAVTQLMVSATDGKGKNVSGVLGMFQAGYVVIMRSVETGSFVAYRVNDAPVLSEDFLTIPVEHIDHDGYFVSSEPIVLGFAIGVDTDLVASWGIPSTHVVGNYLRRNTANTGMEYRTPAQVLTDIGGEPARVTVTQAIAEAGTDTTVRGWTSQRVAQAIDARALTGKISNKTAAYTIVKTDQGSLIQVNSATAVTISLTAAATLTAGFIIGIKNIGAGTVTIDPAGSELIEGMATYSLISRESVVLSCTGTDFRIVAQYRIDGSDLTGMTKAQVGLSNVDNTADTAKPVSTAQQTALNLKANLASPTFTGTPAAPTATTGTNTTQLATTAFVRATIDALIAAAPGTMDTLNELATALGNDPNFATTITNQIATKLNSSAVSSFMLTVLDDADAAAARTTLGSDNAANITTGIIPDARLNSRLGVLARTVTNWDDISETGFYKSNPGATGAPNAVDYFMGLVVVHTAGTTGGYQIQEVRNYGTGGDPLESYIRRQTGSALTGVAWVRRYDTEAELDARYTALMTVSAFAKTLLDDADAATMRATLGAQAILSTVSQVDAEAGTSTTGRIWTAQRVAQAIDARALTGNESIKTADYTIVKADQGDLIVANSTAAMTFTLTAAATLGTNFMVMVKNVNTGVLTIDANGSETIDGSLTYTLNNNESLILGCNGSTWRIIGTTKVLLAGAPGDNTVGANQINGAEAPAIRTKIGIDEAIDARAFTGFESIKTAAYTVVRADQGDTLVANSATAITFTLTAAATIGIGFLVAIKNIGNGALTIDPSGSELIEGVATLILAKGESCILLCNGTEWRAISYYRINGSFLTGLTKSQVGLSNVDNTADSAKPVSTAQQTALNAKLNASNPSFTGTLTGPVISVDANFGFYISNSNPIFMGDANDYFYFDRPGNDWRWVIAGVEKHVFYEDGNISSPVLGILSNKGGFVRYSTATWINFFNPEFVDTVLWDGAVFCGIKAYGGVNTDKRIGQMAYRHLQQLNTVDGVWYNIVSL